LPQRDEKTGRFLHEKRYKIDSKGYICITAGPNRGRREHRVIAEKILGRKLKKKEDVHHDDGHKRHNDPEKYPDNLKVMSHSEHSILEWTLRQDAFLRKQWEEHFGGGGVRCKVRVINA